MKKILIVDDSAFMRQLLKELLSKKRASGPLASPVEILEAVSGQGAIEQFDTEKPDLILLDIVMSESEREGVEALKEIKKRDPNAKVIILTAIGQDSIISECQKLGVEDYIQKPFDPEQTLRAVEKNLS